MLRSILMPIVRQNCPCFAVRGYRRDGNRKPRDLAGIRIQKGILDNADSLEEDPEETYDADFSRLGHSHREHEEEMAFQKEQLKYRIIKSKYFKTEKQPNFLTWAEKEQIRYLNKQEPDEWTPKRLAESFPAIEEVIRKILKAKWSPASMQHIQKHDASAKKNWELLKANQINGLNPMVRSHLEKFSNRNFDSVQNAYVQTNNDQIQFQFPKPKSKEFSSIVSSCKRITVDSQQKKIDHAQLKVSQKEQALIQGGVSQIELKKNLRDENMTYDELMQKTGHTKVVTDEETHVSVSLPKEHSQSESLSQEDYRRDDIPLPDPDDTTAAFNDKKADLLNSLPNDVEEKYIEPSSLYDPVDSNTVNLTVDDISSSKIVKKYEAKRASQITFSAKNPVPFRHKINIPPQLRKRGSVYKLYDCFYDDRGMFMYRVPGLMD